MKPCLAIFHGLVPALILAGPISADMAPQPQVAFGQAAPGTFAADWQGVEGRTYFMLWSLDLVSWQYAPYIGFGGGGHSYGMESSSNRLFVRLFYGDYPGINSLDDAMNADFDGDGLPNVFEVTYGYDPSSQVSTADGPDNAIDPDKDGISNTHESARSLNPMRKDNPKLMLEVTEQ